MLQFFMGTPGSGGGSGTDVAITTRFTKGPRDGLSTVALPTGESLAIISERPLQISKKQYQLREGERLYATVKFGNGQIRAPEAMQISSVVTEQLTPGPNIISVEFTSNSNRLAPVLATRENGAAQLELTPVFGAEQTAISWDDTTKTVHLWYTCMTWKKETFPASLLDADNFDCEMAQPIEDDPPTSLWVIPQTNLEQLSLCSTQFQLRHAVGELLKLSRDGSENTYLVLREVEVVFTRTLDACTAEESVSALNRLPIAYLVSQYEKERLARGLLDQSRVETPIRVLSGGCVPYEGPLTILDAAQFSVIQLPDTEISDDPESPPVIVPGNKRCRIVQRRYKRLKIEGGRICTDISTF
jgi:hypothetical protein